VQRDTPATLSALFAAIVLTGCAGTPAGPEAAQQATRLGMPVGQFLQAFPDAKPVSTSAQAASYQVALPRGCDFCATVGGYLHLRDAREATFQFENARLARAVTPDGQVLPLKPRMGAYAGQLQTRGRPYTWW
jgi:hypothetical protein